MRVFKCESCGKKRTVGVATILSCNCPHCGRLMFPLKENKEPVDEVPCSAGLSDLAVTEEMLTAAMRKGVEVGIFPKHGVDTETYLKHWDGMKKVLETALGI